MRRRSTSEAPRTTLELRDRDELQLVRALLGLHVRRSMGRGLSAGSALVARRLLRRLDQ